MLATRPFRLGCAAAGFLALGAPAGLLSAQGPVGPDMNDARFYLINYIQEITYITDLDNIVGDKTSRATLFGIPLQQSWACDNTGDDAPSCYRQSDALLFYNSFTDAFIASAWLSLTKGNDERLFDAAAETVRAREAGNLV